MNRQLISSSTQDLLQIPDILLDIYDFLPFKDLIKIMPVSTSFYNTINQYFHNFLVKTQVIQSSNDTSKSHSQKNHLLFAEHFCKKMLRFNLRPNHLAKGSFTYLAEMRYLNKKVRDFKEMGPYTCLLLHDKRLIIEEKCMDVATNSSVQVKHCFENVEQFKQNQKMMVCRKKEQFFFCALGQFKEMNLGFAAPNGKVIDFKMTENFFLVITKNTQEKSDLLEGYFLNIEDFTERRQQENTNFTKLHFPESFNQLINYSISNKVAYFVSQNQELYEVELKNSTEPLKIKKSETFSNKKVAKVFSGDGLNFALEVKEKKVFAEFSTEEVLAIAEKIGLDDYLKIMKYSKVKGKDLINCTDDFLKRNYGLRNHTLIQSLRAEMKKHEKTSKEFSLLFWGENSNKQFKFSKSKEKMVTKPEIIQIPTLTECIEEIVAFHDITYLIGSGGSIWATIPKDCQKILKGKDGWMNIWNNGNQDKRKSFISFKNRKICIMAPLICQ